MKVRVLGTGTAVPSLRRLSSSYLVQTNQCNILVDAGPSVVRRLLECGITVDDIDVIIITHFHVDHTADLSTFLFACNYGEVTREKPLFIIGGKGTRRFYQRLLGVYPWIDPKSYALRIRSLSGGIVEYGDVQIKAGRVNHNAESIAVRISNEKSVVFSGDTDFSRNLARLACGVDLLVAECAFPERKVKGHLNLVLLDKLVKQGAPKRVLLSHLYPDWDSFTGVLHAPYLLGEDGLEIEV